MRDSYPYNDPFAPKKNGIFSNPGFRFGFVGALIAVSINLIFILIYDGETNGDLIAWFLQIIIYFFISRSAAEVQYNQNQQRGEFEHLRGVKAAGLGAGLTTSVLVWLYIIIRGVLRDAFGVFIFVEPFSLFCLIAVDVSIAMALGSWGGSAVARKYDAGTPY